MIGTHCGKRLWALSENRFYFRKKCQVCGKIFKQHKRMPIAKVKACCVPTDEYTAEWLADFPSESKEQ